MAYPTIREITIDELLAESGADSVNIEARGDEARDDAGRVIPGLAVLTLNYGKATVVKTLSTRHINADDALRECARMAKADRDAGLSAKKSSDKLPPDFVPAGDGAPTS